MISISSNSLKSNNKVISMFKRLLPDFVINKICNLQIGLAKCFMLFRHILALM